MSIAEQKSPTITKTKPAPVGSKGPAVIIGSGFGGLAAAIRLQAKGYATTLLEMRDKPGGRAYVFEDKGFTFDAGPTIITVPFVLDELAALNGKTIADYVEIVPCDPFYRIYFADGREFNYVGDKDRIEAEIAKFNPDDVEGYRRFLAYTEKVFDRAFTDLADHSFHSIWEMVKVSPDLIKLRADQSVYKKVSSFIKDESLRQVFSFEPLLIGGNPLRSSSIYSMIHFLEKTWGVHFAMGGTGALVNGLVKLFEELGGKLVLNARAEEIEVASGKVHAVRLASGERFAADVVVSNGDVTNTYRKLIRPEHRRKWTDKRLEKMNFAMSLFVAYFGTDRTYPHLPHHSIILGPRYHGLLGDIFDKKIVADDFSLYLHAPTRTDPSDGPSRLRGVLRPQPGAAPRRRAGLGRDPRRVHRPDLRRARKAPPRPRPPQAPGHVPDVHPQGVRDRPRRLSGLGLPVRADVDSERLVSPAQPERGRRRPVLRRRRDAPRGGLAGGDLQRQGPGEVPLIGVDPPRQTPLEARGARLCRRITRHYAKTFYFASACLPRATRAHAYAVYGFCRWADNGVDDARDRAEAAERLDEARAALDLAYGTAPTSRPGCWRSGGRSERAGSPGTCSTTSSTGWRWTSTSPATRTSPRSTCYCYRVAGVVGLMMTHVLGFTSDRCIPNALALGTAMQLTNILRDVAEDLALGRVYLPQDELARFGVTERDLADGPVTDPLRALIRFQIDRARRYYAEAEAGIPLLDGDAARLTVRVMGRAYAGILGAIERQDLDVFRARARVSTPRKLATLAGCQLDTSRDAWRRFWG